MIKKLYLIFIFIFMGCSSIKTSKYSYLEDLKSNDEYEIIELIEINEPYTYDYYSHGKKQDYYSVLKDENNKLFISVKNEDNDDKFIPFTLNKKFELSMMDEEYIKNSNLKLSNLYYTYFISNEEDEDYIKRNSWLQDLNPKSAKPIVKYKLESGIFYFFKNIHNVFCWNLDSSKCSKSSRKATYYIDIPTRNGTIKLKSEGNSVSSFTGIFYLDDLASDDAFFIKKGKKIFVVKMVDSKS